MRRITNAYLIRGIVHNLHFVIFVSTLQRLLLYNAYATKAMCDAGFDILDTFPMTDSHPNGTGLPHKPYDAVHYPISTFVTAAELLERYFEETT